MLFEDKEAYTEEIEEAGLEKLANLIKICGFIMQNPTFEAYPF